MGREPQKIVVEYEPQQDNSLFMIGLVVGALVGGILAGLLAPRSGEETRMLVRERGLELKGRADTVVQRTQSAANTARARVYQSTQSLTGRGSTEGSL